MTTKVTETTKVTLTRRGHVSYLTIARPHVSNALDLDAHRQLCALLDEFEADGEQWVAVLTGAGDRCFCAGQDLKELAARNRSGVQPTSLGSGGVSGSPRLTERFGLTKPIVARVNGHAIGGGLELMLACDLAIAADHATFALPEVRLGLVAGAGGAIRLPRQLPPKIALGHLLTGRPMTAATAHRYGLVNEVVPAAQLDACVESWVADLVACSPVAVRAAKEIATRSRELPLEEAFAARYSWEEKRRTSPDAVEGPAAFVERRAPRWQNPSG
ncbi:enoyl-CoA-hydratase DpgD [Kribbella soli]|uniref:Enoyl-CoA hydratase n=1 Tax=Kribbella soli TaxID=1124743 RepID=A0A4R0H9X2_9ACTN|nr:enoyl-CoA-hydratase DpgD [Kribbella soli]TCC06314.1 enoyl-CoA hydratase [Kribbella soli]